MNEDYLGGDLMTKTQSMLDFNYKISRPKSSRKITLQMFTSRGNQNNFLNYSSYSPVEIFDANNKINSILSKNLKSIFNETRNENSQDIPLFKNINTLIQKNNDSNRFYYNQMKMYYQNNIFNSNSLYHSHINPVTESAFKDSEIIDAKNYASKYGSLSRTSIKNTIDMIHKLDKNKVKKRKSNSKLNRKKNKNNKKRGSGSINANTKTNILVRKKSKFGTQKAERLSGTYDILGKDDHDNLKSLLNDNFNIDKTPKNQPGLIIQNLNFNKNKNNFNKDIQDSYIHNNKFLKAMLNKKRFLSINNKNFKFNSSIKPQGPKFNPFIESSNKYNPIANYRDKINNSSITKSFIEHKMPLIKRELDVYDNYEIAQMIDRLPKEKSDRKKKLSLERINIVENINNMNISEKNELIPSNDVMGKVDTLEDDRFQKKYRKLFLNKNLYDSLDDEEVIDEEIIYNFYISTNSITIYILDSIVLIAIIFEIYYLPVYTSFHISSYKIYTNIFDSVIFYLIDLIYIIDLITGFFRAYYNFEEVLVKKNTDIYSHYLTGWFILDLIEAFPFFTLLDYNMRKLKTNFVSSNHNSNNMFDFELNNNFFALTFLKLIKIFKIFGSNATINQINKLLDKSKFFYEWKGLFSTVFIALSSLHMFSCFFVFIGRNESQGWIVDQNLQNNNYIDLYITALYYLITTLTTVGYGDITGSNILEIIYGIFTLIVGTCAYSWILTYISNYIKKNNEKYIDFEEKMKMLNEIKLEYPNLGKSLKDRIARYLNYNKSENKFNLKCILESLPSALQNNLIIEIYKPIIENFQFFKSFENSDFFVKIVTSLKPILSMKDDILIQEGDIIEDIIFIKNGVLTLEIIIDLKDSKKSVESHLEMTGMDCFKNISNHKFNTIRNLNSMTSMNTMITNIRREFNTKFYKDNKKNRKKIKIIDLRKNEHFGDILMILNEKSPLTVKVKSKKAELFFLQKTEATEISNRYPNIWKRIVNKSLQNMKQIKNLIRKKLFIFSEENNIDINPEIKKKYLQNDKSIILSLLQNLESKGKNSDNIDTIIEEEDESNIISQTIEKHSRLQTGKIFGSKNRKSIVSEYKNSKYMSTKKNSLDNIGKISELNIIGNKEEKEKNNDLNILKDSNKDNNLENIEKNLEIKNDINKVDDVINIVDKEIKNSSLKNQIHNLSINIYAPKVKIPIKQVNIENHYSSTNNKKEEEINNSSMLGNINSEISFGTSFINDMKNNDISMYNSDENSHIYYPSMKFNKDKKNKIDNNKSKYTTNIFQLFNSKDMEKDSDKDINNEKQDIKTNDKISNKCIKNISNEKCDIDVKSKKDNKYICLDTTQSTSFTINSIYENINEISKYTYHKNSELRSKIKKIILEQINNNETMSTQSLSNILKNNHKKLFSTKYTMKFNNKKLFRKKAESLDISRKNLNKTSYFRAITRKSIHGGIPSNLKLSDTFKKDDEFLFKEKDVNSHNEKVYSKDNAKTLNPFKNKPLKRHKSVMMENEITFYNKINRLKTMRKKNINIQEEKPEKDNKIGKMNYNRLISKNIEKNQQNLNNPEEYFEGFFNDIIFNKKGNNIKDNANESIKKRKTIKKIIP